ncbi:MAG TPA: RNA 3'-terminal phosphate cyclase [Nitrososphaerales archaeon]|nr:RNA 3'-terminal phosphate cyclase [Nitrososphaerales archaeon]
MDIIEIDGSMGEGGGQIIRTAVTLASIFNKPIRITNIRAKRKQPGLRPQHLQSVLTSAKLCGAKLDGATVGSTQIEYKPSKLLKSFKEPIDTGTAGSVSLIAQTIIPISLFGGINLDAIMVGGTEVPNSPTVDYLDRIVLPIYKRLGAKIEFKVTQRGYYPKGGGILKLNCSRQSESKPLSLDKVVSNRSAASIFSCSRSLPKHVSLRQVESAKAMLARGGVETIGTNLDNEGRSLSPGSSILIYDVSDSRFVGASGLGERGKPSERVGEEAAKDFLKEIAVSPNVDSHLADMLVTLLACVKGNNSFTTSFITDHFTTNMEVAKKISGCDVEYHKEGSFYKVNIGGSSEKPN